MSRALTSHIVTSSNSQIYDDNNNTSIITDYNNALHRISG